MRSYGRDPDRHYEVRNGIWGQHYRERPCGVPAKPVVKLLLVLALIIVIASFI
jgi:hypothetical protein